MRVLVLLLLGGVAILVLARLLIRRRKKRKRKKGLAHFSFECYRYGVFRCELLAFVSFLPLEEFLIKVIKLYIQNLKSFNLAAHR